MGKVKAPFTPTQVERLNAFQQGDNFHHFTCPGDTKGCHGQRTLIATTQGWLCACGQYTQDWCHSFMLEENENEEDD